MDETLDLDRFLPYRLNRLAATASRDLQATYRTHHDITVPEWRTLATLGQFGELTATAIGRHASMHKTKVSRAIAALEGRRWVVRATNPRDRREATVRLTPAGRTAYTELAAVAAAFCERLLAGLGPAERATVESALDVLENRLGIRRGPPSDAR